MNSLEKGKEIINSYLALASQKERLVKRERDNLANGVIAPIPMTGTRALVNCNIDVIKCQVLKI